MNPAIEGIVAAAGRALSLLFLRLRRVSCAQLDEPRDERRLEHFRCREYGVHSQLLHKSRPGLQVRIARMSFPTSYDTKLLSADKPGARYLTAAHVALCGVGKRSPKHGRLSNQRMSHLLSRSGKDSAPSMISGATQDYSPKLRRFFSSGIFAGLVVTARRGGDDLETGELAHDPDTRVSVGSMSKRGERVLPCIFEPCTNVSVGRR